MAGLLNQYMIPGMGILGNNPYDSATYGGTMPQIDLSMLTMAQPMKDPWPGANLPPNAQLNMAQPQQQQPMNIAPAAPDAQGGSGGFLGGLGNILNNNPMTLLALGTGLLSDGWGGAKNAMVGAKMDQESKITNLTQQALIKNGISPELAPIVAKNPALLSAVFKKQLGGSTYGLNPIYGKDSNGNTVLLQTSDTGDAKQTTLPQGVSVSTGIEKTDLGTSYLLTDKKSGAVIGTVAKDLRGAEREKGVGEAQGKALATAPSDIQAGENALALIDKIRSSPSLEMGTGMSSYLNAIPGTGGYDFQNLVDGAKSGAFLQAVGQMRGLGSLSDAEGRAATAAINRMNVSTSKNAFLDALGDYEKIVNQGISRAKSRLSNPDATNPAPVAPTQNVPADPLGIRR